MRKQVKIVLALAVGFAFRTYAYLPDFEVQVEGPGKFAPDLTGTKQAEIKVKGTAGWRGTITIRDQAGRLLRVLYCEPGKDHKAGEWETFSWDGADEAGFLVPDGKHTVRVEALRYPAVSDFKGLALMMDKGFICRFDRFNENIYLSYSLQNDYPMDLAQFLPNVIHKFAIEGLIMGDEVQLETKNNDSHNNIYTDIYDNFYATTGSHGIGEEALVYKYDRKGKVLWCSNGELAAVDPKTGKTETNSFGPFNPVVLWPTARVAWTSNGGHSPSPWRYFQIDVQTGRFLHMFLPGIDTLLPICQILTPATFAYKQKIPEPVSQICADRWGNIISVNGACYGQFGGLFKYNQEGKLTWGLMHTDLNSDGDFLDASVDGGWGENAGFGGGYAGGGPCCDVEGSIYGAACGVQPYKAEKSMPGILKADCNGQALLCVGLPDNPAGGRRDVTPDGKLICFTSLLRNGLDNPMASVYELDWAEGVVEVVSGRKAEVKIGTSVFAPSTPLRATVDKEAQRQEEKPPQTAGEWIDQGWAQSSRKNWKEAVAAFTQAGEAAEKAKDRDLQPAALWHGLRVALRGNLEPDIAKLSKEIDGYKEIKSILHQKLCERALKRKDYEQAKQEAGKAFTAADNKYDKARSAILKVEVLRQASQLEEAIKECDDLVKVYPHTGGFGKLTLAELYEVGAREKEVIAIYKEVYGRFPEYGNKAYDRHLKLTRSGISEPNPWPILSSTTGEPGKAGDWVPDIGLGRERIIGHSPTYGFAGPSLGGLGSDLKPDDPKILASFWYPVATASNGKKLAVAEFCGARVKIFDPIPTQTFAVPQVWIGVVAKTDTALFYPGSRLSQPGMKKILKETGKDATFAAGGVALDDKRLYVSDFLKNRILVYEPIPTETGALPTLVLGQPDFAQGKINNGGISAKTLYHPSGLYSDGTRLFATDRRNNRVLIWNKPPTEVNQAADVVLGQKDFTTRELDLEKVTGSSLNHPCGLYFDGTRLYVADTANQRILIWNKLPKKNGQSADLVLGADGLDQRGELTMERGGPGGANIFAYPMDVYSDGQRLWVADTWNSRLVYWDHIPEKNNEPATGVIGQQAHYYYSDSHCGGGLAGNLPMSVRGDGQNLYVMGFRHSGFIYRLK